MASCSSDESLCGPRRGGLLVPRRHSEPSYHCHMSRKHAGHFQRLVRLAINRGTADLDLPSNLRLVVSRTTLRSCVYSQSLTACHQGIVIDVVSEGCRAFLAHWSLTPMSRLASSLSTHTFLCSLWVSLHVNKFFEITARLMYQGNSV